MPTGDSWPCPFCAASVPNGCAHSCPAPSARPWDRDPPQRLGGFIPPPPTREEVARMIPKGLTEDDVRRIVREELSAAAKNEEREP